MDDLRKQLFRALEKSDLNMLRAVLAQGTSARFEEGDHFPPLMEAINCNRNDLEVLEELRKAGADIAEREPYHLDSILHWAMWRDTPAVLHWCLANGADVDAPNKEGMTPLMRAMVLAGSCEDEPDERAKVLRDIGILLKAGASVLIANGERKTVLHYAAEQGAMDVAIMVLERGAEVDARDKTGTTSLMAAAENGHVEIVDMLLDKAADVNVTDLDGRAIG